jgi:hypothetical protein
LDLEILEYLLNPEYLEFLVYLFLEHLEFLANPEHLVHLIQIAEDLMLPDSLDFLVYLEFQNTPVDLDYHQIHLYHLNQKDLEDLDHPVPTVEAP